MIGSAIACGCLGFGYGVNALAERTTDLSALKNPFLGMPSLPVQALVAVGGCAVVALGLAVLLGPIALGAALTSLVAGAL